MFRSLSHKWQGLVEYALPQEHKISMVPHFNGLTMMMSLNRRFIQLTLSGVKMKMMTFLVLTVAKQVIVCVCVGGGGGGG